MSRHTEIKQKVLRGVFEDNAGIPRSFHGKGRSRDAPVARPSTRTHVYRRAALVFVLGLVTLLGINFRLVRVDGTGPVAMQVATMPPLQFPTLPPGLLAGSTEEPATGPERLADGQSVRAAAHPVSPTGQYDAMLARLGIPVADLFNLEIQTIVIDPGHGGIDPGATGHGGLEEKDVVLDIAKRLRDKLVRSGHYRVLLTREDDRKVFLKERVAFAKENHADLFISIHINSLPDGAGNYNYVETYYFGPHADRRALELAEQENRDSDYRMADFRQVIARIGDTLKTEESKQLAGSIHDHLYGSLRHRVPGLLDAGSKAGPFVVLLGVEVPSVLVEVSCISNPAEETRLGTPAYRDHVADYLMAGITGYLEQRTNRRSIERGLTQNVAEQER
jgi:N-acetylmuramoyl-L-alanine amidase